MAKLKGEIETADGQCFEGRLTYKSRITRGQGGSLPLRWVRRQMPAIRRAGLDTDNINELIRQLTPDDRAWRDALRPVITKYMSEQQFVPKTVLELEAEDLNKTVCAFEEQLRKNGRSAAEIAKAIRDRLGGRVTAADIKSGNVWWR